MTTLKSLRNLLDSARVIQQVTGSDAIGPNGESKFGLDVNLLNGLVNSIIISPGEMSKIIYGEIPMAAANTWHVVKEYIVPDNFDFYLMLVEMSGGNVSKYRVKIDDEIVGLKRSWWNNWNVTFKYTEGFSGHRMASGAKITIEAFHSRPCDTSYEGCIIGVEKDLSA